MRGPVRALIPPPPPPSAFLSISLAPSHPPQAHSLLPPVLPRSFFPLVPSILFRLVRAPPMPTPRFLVPSSSRLDSSTLGAYESTQPDTTRVRRSEFGDPLLPRRGSAREFKRRRILREHPLFIEITTLFSCFLWSVYLYTNAIFYFAIIHI